MLGIFSQRNKAQSIDTEFYRRLGTVKIKNRTQAACLHNNEEYVEARKARSQAYREDVNYGERLLDFCKRNQHNKVCVEIAGYLHYLIKECAVDRNQAAYECLQRFVH